jgi:sialate O-acetylesterase
MRIKWQLFILCLIVVLNSCKKDNNFSPISPPPSNPVQGNYRFSVSNVLQSNMVIQRNKPFIIWGKAQAHLNVSVNVSWNQSTFTGIADGSGKWKVAIPEAAANTTAQTITVSADTATITFKNILIGDVWICSGQSNMVFEVSDIPPFRGVINYAAEIAAANYPNIRAITLQSDLETGPVDTLTSPANWVVCSPSTVGNISGVAYYFARKLYTDLNVPIGIVISAVDGTSCEAWIDKASFTANPSFSEYGGINDATMLYNGMINPLTNLAITGFIWYQGENNRYNSPASDYTHLNSMLIQGWRSAFNQGPLPFYLVQLPPFAVDYYSTNPVGGDLTADDYAKFREAQANVLAVSNTGMAVTMDVGEPANIHPENKKPVGERLALLALKNVYSQNVQCYGPKYSSYSVNGNTATISFAPGTADGLNTINNAALKQYFFVAGADHVFSQATAVINGNTIVITAPVSVTSSIQAIRYAFTNAPVTNLQNSASLPMEPFRTDDWDN